MNRLFTRWGGLLIATFVLVTSCGGSDDPEPAPTPTPTPTPVTGTVTITAPQVSDITVNSAQVRAQVTPSSGLNVTDRGFCYSTSSNPTTSDKTAKAQINDMLVTLSGLEASTTYYIKGYAVSDLGTTYSEATSFTTEAQPEATLENYVAPTYQDDYRNFSGWNDRAKWNLANVHDPTVMLADDGYYYMYQTDASFGNAHDGHGHFHGRRSKNLVDWEYLGGTMTAAPAWVKDTLNNSRARFGLPAINNPSYGYWAPCARKVRTGLYRMYYAIVVDNYILTGKANTTANFDKSWTERAFIGVMETSDPASNNWEDKGFVVSSMSDKEKNWARSSTSDWSGYFYYNAIDPTYIITPSGEHWLIFGSWHSGFAALQLNADTGKPISQLPEFCTTKTELDKVMKRVYTRKNGDRWQASEAPEVVYRNGYYYLFMAYDGLDVPYNTRVVRSEKVDGPYYTIGGTNVTQSGGDAQPIMTHPYKFGNDHGWVGISHCAIWDDGNDNWYYASQGRYPNDYDSWAPNAIMLGHVRRVLWTEDGWPVVLPERYGAVPQVAITEAELIGEWENINLGYSYGKQKTSTTITLKDDHTVSGSPFAGNAWSFDAAKNVLTIGSNKLTLARECDWEASPRKHTIVYAGITTTTTYWGKKK